MIATYAIDSVTSGSVGVGGRHLPPEAADALASTCLDLGEKMPVQFQEAVVRKGLYGEHRRGSFADALRTLVERCASDEARPGFMPRLKWLDGAQLFAGVAIRDASSPS